MEGSVTYIFFLIATQNLDGTDCKILGGMLINPIMPIASDAPPSQVAQIHLALIHTVVMCDLRPAYQTFSFLLLINKLSDPTFHYTGVTRFKFSRNNTGI